MRGGLAIAAVLAGLMFGSVAAAQPDPTCSQPSPAEIRAAQISVYYFAQAVPMALPQAWKPIDLHRAARIIHCDGSPGHAGRRRRAAAKLGGGIAVLQGTPSPMVGMHAAKLGAALTQLGVPVDDLSAHLQTVPQPSRARFEIEVQRFLDGLNRAEFSKACCACLLECVAGSNGELATVRFKSSVHRGLGHLKPILDPQRWDDKECGKGFFTATSHAGDTCTTASETDPSTNDPSPGSGWKGVLLEEFQYDYKQSGAGNGNAGLKNFLDIDIQQTDQSYVLEYGLCKSISGSMTDPNGMVSALGLSEDCGYCSAFSGGANAPNDTQVRGVKRLQFSTTGLTDLTVIGLKIMADMITYDVLCCDAGGESPPEQCDCADKLCDEGEPIVSQEAEPALCKRP